MKKLMALCLSVLMVLSMCSFTVMAEGTAVDFSAIANGQPANFVTSNLVLGENTITSSSNTDVIATDGTVKRPLFEDATVSLTINGGEAVEVTVKAQTTNVLYSEDFAIAEATTATASNKHTFVNYPEWYIGSANNGGSAVADGVFSVNHTDGSGRVWLYHAPKAPTSDEIYTIRFDSASVSNVATGIDIRIDAVKYNAEGTKVGSIAGQTVSRLASSGWGGYWMGAYRKNNVEIKYDPMTGDFWGNGVLNATNNLFAVGKFETGCTVDDVAKVVITNITIVDASDSATGNYTLDNWVEYQSVPAETVLANATPAEKSAYYSQYLEAEYVANGGNFAALTTNLKFAPAEELIDGVSIAWTSTNPAVVAEDGTIKRPMFEAATATVTGTLSVEGAEDVVVNYTVNVLPLTQSFVSEVADAESLTPGTSFVGATGWTSSIQSWERMDVGEDADGNNYYSICASAYQPSGTSPQYTFASYPTALAAGETLVFEAKVRVPVKTGLANWGLLLNGNEMAEFIYYNQYLYDNDYDLGSDGYYGPSAARADKNITANTWYKIKFEIYANAESATGYSVKCYIDDKLVGTHKTKSAVPATITSAKFQFTGRSNMDSTTAPTTPVNFFHTDDIKLYITRPASDVLTTLPDAEKVSFFKTLVEESNIGTVSAVGAVLDLDNGYADYDPATYGVNVDWASSNTAYIANDGTLVKLASIGENVVVNMTATISAGEAEATVTIPVTVADGTTLIKAIDFSTDTSTGSAEIVADEDASHGSVLHLKNEGTGHKATGSIVSIDGATCTDRVILKADVKYTHNGAAGSSGAISFKTIAGSNGINIYLNYNTGKVQVNSTVAYLNGNNTAVDANKALYFDMPQSVIEKGEGEWVNVMVDHNVLSQTMYIYIDGQLLNELPILQANMKLPANGGSAIRGYSLELSSTGEIWVDNISLSKYVDQNAVEVNAALNAALFDYASAYNKPVLTNCALPAMTIGKSWWISGTLFDRDLDNGALKPSNPAGYTYVTDGPAITWKIGNDTVTAINVTSPKEVTMTVTATANGIAESKTFTRLVAPVAIRTLTLGTADCLNGAWIEGAAGDEKLVVAKYLGGKLVDTSIVDFAETEAWDSKTGTGDRYNEENGVVNNLSTENPKVTAAYDQVKLFVVKADGITPIAYANAELHD